MRREHVLTVFLILLICGLLVLPVAGQENKVRPVPKELDEAAVAETHGRDAGKRTRGEDLEIRAYRVADLLIATPSYPYTGQDLPTIRRQDANLGFFGGMGGMGRGGGMFGGMGGGMGGMGMGGMGTGTQGAESPQGGGVGAGGGGTGIGKGGWGPFRGSDDSPLFNSPDGLIEAITMMVDPESWADVGGEGSLEPFGGLLLVRQTPENHEKIDELLETIRSEGTTAQTVVVEARWLLLDADQRDELLHGEEAAKPDGRSPLTVDPAACERLSREMPGYRGRITCFSGQTVHLVSGTRRSVVTGAIPVVGSGIGYQPQTATPNVGVLLQVTPSLLPGMDAAILDVQSTVTGWEEPERVQVVGSNFPATQKLDPASQELVNEPGAASLTVDRVTIPAQELAATLRVPLDEPVLVGGLTLGPDEMEPSEPNEGNRKQLYLVVRVSAAEEERSDQSHGS